MSTNQLLAFEEHKPRLTSVMAGEDRRLFKKILYFYIKKGTKIIDVTCGHRIFWQDVNLANFSVLFCDIRREVKPTVVCDLLSPPFKPNIFDALIFDPPHLDLSETSMFYWKYGSLSESDMTKMLQKVIEPFTYILKPNGILIAKIFDDRRHGTVRERHTELANSLKENFEFIDIIVKWSRRQKKAQENWRGGQKNPRRSIPQHSYFLIFRKKNIADYRGKANEP